MANGVRWQRARRPEQKEERLTSILDSAAELFRESPISDITLSAIAQGAGLAKGSVYRYFATKEEVLLGVLSRELEGWFAEVDRGLRRLRGRDDPDAVAALVTRTLRSRGLLTHLLSRLSSDLEHNLSEEVARSFKQGLLRSLGESGALLEAALPSLPAGAGGRFLLHLHALVSGLWPMAHPVGAIATVLQAPEMAPMRVDFPAELSVVLRALLRGLSAG